MINAQTLQGHWNELKGNLREHWGALTNDDVRRFDGDLDQLVGLIQKKTGESRESIETFLEELTGETASMVAEAVGTAREYASRAVEGAHQSYDQVADQLRDRYADAEDMVRTRPLESLMITFGVGLFAGVIAGLMLRKN